MTRRHFTWLSLAAGLAGGLALAELAAQELHFTGGAVEGSQVRTNTVASLYDNQDPGTGFTNYLRQPSSILTVHREPGDSDLFVYEIDAGCNLAGAGLGDYVDVQARVNRLTSRSMVPLVCDPRTSRRTWRCAPPVSAASVAKSWAVRLSGGSSGTDCTFMIFWRRSMS